MGLATFTFNLSLKNEALSENTTIATSENTLTKALKDARHVDSELSSQIDNINIDIAALREKSLSDAEDKIHKLNDEMQTLRKQLENLSNNINHTASASSSNLPTSLSNQDNQDNQILNIEEREEEMTREVEQQLDLYESTAAQEGIDQSWAIQAQTEVYESFKALSADDVGVSEVQCHSSFCQAKVELSGDNNQAAIRKLQQVSPWQGESFIWIKDIDQGEGMIYLAREGQVLPSTP